MPFFKSSNASKSSFMSTSSSAPLNPRDASSIFDSSSPKSPLYSPDYQVPVHSLADSIAILLRNNTASSSKKSQKANKVELTPREKAVAEENKAVMAALEKMRRQHGGMPNLTML